jgi:hypothetical protein
MFGFLNVFAAGIIAMRHNISDRGLVEVIMNENIKNFNFTNDYFSWHNWEINLEDVKYARKFLMTSLGGSSFNIPIEELKLLGLL